MAQNRPLRRLLAASDATDSCCEMMMSRQRWHQLAHNFARWYISVLDRSSPLLRAVPTGEPPNPQIRNFGNLTMNIRKWRVAALHVS